MCIDWSMTTRSARLHPDHIQALNHIAFVFADHKEIVLKTDQGSSVIDRFKTVPAILLLTLGIFVSGCTSTSGVVRTGPDTFMISRTEKGFKGSSGIVKAAALDEATRYAESNGKVMKVISTSQKDMIPFKSDASAEVHFKLLDPNDPELKMTVNTDSLGTRVFKGDEDVQRVSVEIDQKKTVSQPTDLYAEISKLDELRKKGLLTDAEFETEKRKLLSRSR
jgi:hypothetical protein